MPPLTEKQKKKLERIKEVLEMDNLAIAKMIMELEDKLEEELPHFKNIIERIKGDKGDAYQITKKDYKEIAKETREFINDEKIANQVLDLIDIDLIAKQSAKLVPKPKDADDKRIKEELKKELPKLVLSLIDFDEILNKTIEKATNSVKSSIEIPIPKDGSPDTAEDIRNKLELLDGDERLKIEAIRDLREELDELKKTKTVQSALVSDRRIAQSFKYIAHTEQPSGDIDGVNTTYTVANTIWWIAGFTLNGEQIAELPNFTYSGNTITFSSAIPAVYSGKDWEIKYIGT